MNDLTPEARAELYRQIFEVDKRGAAILEDMTARFASGAVLPRAANAASSGIGGIEAVLHTYHRMGQHDVIQHIVRQINIANRVDDAPPPEDSQ